jgi:hypoxanthine-DNA glycosylase
MTKIWKEGLAPVIAKTSRVLILGSLPGDMSLRMQQYYANPRNHFWQILGAVFGCTLQTSYEEKIQFVLTQGLALWDVLKAADRKGSLDANITKAIPNEFGELLATYPNIRVIALNGGKAAAHFRAVQKRDPRIFAGRQCIELPSSSGVPGKNVLSLQEKIKRWAAIRVAEPAAAG